MLLRPYVSDSVKRLPVFLVFYFIVLSAQAATLAFDFQLGEQQLPRLDRLLRDVPRQMVFGQDGETLIVREMAGAVVEWDIPRREKREISRTAAKRWFAYSVGTNQLLVRETDGIIAILSVENGESTRVTDGAYESGSLTATGTLAVLSQGDSEVEVWRIGESRGTTAKLKTLRTGLPVRNGLTVSEAGEFIAAAEGTYREGEGHRTIVEVWNATDKRPVRVFDTGDILGVWNLRFSPDATMLAVDTQRNGQSGIRVWDIQTGRQRLVKSGFDAYWTRALAFSPTSQYLATGDEAGNLRIWDIWEGEAVIWETYATGIQTLAFSPNGDYLAVALWDTTIQMLRWRHHGKEDKE